MSRRDGYRVLAAAGAVVTAVVAAGAPTTAVVASLLIFMQVRTLFGLRYAAKRNAYAASNPITDAKMCIKSTNHIG